MIDVQQILRDGRIRRASEKRRRNVIESFRKNTERSIASAVFYMVLALVHGGSAFFSFSTQKDVSSWDRFYPWFMLLMTGFWIRMSVGRLWLSHRDKLLLLILDEVLEKQEPNQTAEPTIMSVTPPATQEPRQP